jgi:hypothetical protein
LTVNVSVQHDGGLHPSVVDGRAVGKKTAMHGTGDSPEQAAVVRD